MRFRLKSISTYVYFLVWLAFSFLYVASESFGPVANGNGKVLLNGPYANTFNDLYSCLFGLIVIAAIFGTVHPARLSARHLPDSVHQTDLQIRLPWGPLGRIVRHDRSDLHGLDDRHLSRNLRAVGGSRPHRAQSFGVVSAALPVDRRGADIFHRLAVLRGRRAHAQDLHRVSAGRGAVHALRHRPHGILGDSLAGAFLVAAFSTRSGC